MMKYRSRIRIVIACFMTVVLLLSLFSCKPTDEPKGPQTPDEVVAAVFGDEPYSLCYQSRSGKVGVSNIVFHPNVTEDYTLVIPETAYGSAVTQLWQGEYLAFRSLDASGVPCVMTQAAFDALMTSIEKSDLTQKEKDYARACIQYCFEDQNLALAKTEKTKQMMRQYFPLVDHTVIYNVKADITQEELLDLSEWLTKISYTQADKEQAYEELILMTGEHLEEDQYFDSLWYLGSHSAKYMTGLELPDSLTEIQSGALAGCTRLENIRFAGTMAQWTAIKKGVGWNDGVPATVVHCTDGDAPIDARKPSVGLAFRSNGDGTCSVSGIGTCMDTDVVIPTVSSEDEDGEVVVAIDRIAFNFCQTITSVTIPDSVTTIGALAFQRCDNLKRVELDSQVTGIGRYAFRGCASLTGIVLPDSLTEVEESVFKNCTSLQKVVFPDNLTQIGKEAFANCTSLTELVFPGSLTYVYESAFMGCTGLTDIVFLTNTEPQAYNSIQNKAFYGCENLSSVVFSDQLRDIGADAFCWCMKLTTVVIPDSVESIGVDAFGVCWLEQVTIGRNVQDRKSVV